MDCKCKMDSLKVLSIVNVNTLQGPEQCGFVSYAFECIFLYHPSQPSCLREMKSISRLLKLVETCDSSHSTNLHYINTTS